MEERKRQRLAELRTAITEQVNMAASEVGGLTEDESDYWWTELEMGIQDGFEGVVACGSG